MENNNILELKGVGKSLKGNRVVDQVSWQMAKGQVVGLLGPNGAGKSTLLKLIMGIFPLDQGEIFFDSVRLDPFPIHKRVQLGIGYISQEPLYFRTLTVTENISALLELAGVSRHQIPGRCDEILLKVGLADKAGQVAHQLSAGEKRWLDLAFLFIYPARLVLVDEPFTGIDPAGVNCIKAFLRQLNSAGISLILTDHQVGHILSICHQVHLLDQGRLLFSGPPLAFSANPAAKAFLGEAD